MDQQQPATGPPNNTKIAVTVAVLLIAVLMVAGIKAFAAKDDTSTDATNASAKQSSANSSSDSSSASYKDGTYSATGSYDSPGGTEKITISVTLKDDTISDTSATAGATNHDGEEYQERFISGYKSLVVGKPIDAVKLSRVSGSSLTSQGFNEAIGAIKDQAKS
jgi:uncharacterized protein with FMN-binding domain